MNSKLTMTFLFITVMLDASGYGIIAPVLPNLIQEVGHSSIGDAARIGGYMTVAFGVMQFFAGPIIGNLSDALGRKVVLLFSLFGMMLDYIVLALAPSVAWLIVGRMIGGVFSATEATANAVVIDISSPSQKAKNFGIIGAAFGIGFVLGPALGGVLSLFGTRGPFWGAAAITACNFAFGFFFFKETLEKSKRRAFSLKSANPLMYIHKIFLSPIARSVAIILIFYGISTTSISAVWAFFTEDRFNFQPWMIAVTLVLFSISSTITQIALVRPTIRRFGSIKVIWICLLAQSAALLIIAFTFNIWLLVVIITLGGLVSIVAPAFQNLLTGLISDRNQGELQGVLSSIQSLTSLVGTLLMTQCFALFTDDKGIKFAGAPFVLGAIFTFAAYILFRMILRKKSTLEILKAADIRDGR